jgi:hypothetical protein
VPMAQRENKSPLCPLTNANGLEVPMIPRRNFPKRPVRRID